jgi:hypothetical protein
LDELARGREHRVRADPAKLVHAPVTADEDVVLQRHMARQHGAVAHHDAVAEHAVVRDVDIGQERVIVTHAGEVAVIGRGMDGDILAEDIAVANAHPGVAALELEILRFGSDAREREYLAPPAEHRVALDRAVVVDARAIPEAHARTNKGKRADLDIGAELGTRLNDGGGIDTGGHWGRELANCYWLTLIELLLRGGPGAPCAADWN